MPSRTNFSLKDLKAKMSILTCSASDRTSHVLPYKTVPRRCKQAPTCPFLVLSLTGSFRNHTAYNCQPWHSPSQTSCRHGPAHHQPPALSQIRVEESSLPTTRRCFVRVTYWRERDFSRRWQNCPHLRSHLCQISFTSFPRMAACTISSRQGWATTRSLLPGVQFSWALCFKEPPKRAGLRLFWNLGIHVAVLRKQPGLPNVNWVCCEHMGSAPCWRTRSCFTHLGISSRKSELH